MKYWCPLTHHKVHSLLPSVIKTFLFLSLAPPAAAAAASFLHPGPASRVSRCRRRRRPALSHLMRLTCSLEKGKKGRWGGEIAPAKTATLILCTQDLCLLQSFAASVSSPLRPRRPGSRCADERARSLWCIMSGFCRKREPGTSKHASKLPKSFTEKHKAKS